MSEPSVGVPTAQSYRDLVLATYSSTLSLAGILLALLGFLLARYDVLKADTTIDPERLRPFRIIMVAVAALVVVSAFAALLAFGWLYTFAAFPYPLWVAAALIVALALLAAATIRLRW